MDGKTQYEAWFGHKPNVSLFRVFSSKAWDRIHPNNRDTLQPQIKERIMVVYNEYAKWYKSFDPSSQKTFIETSVHFEEEFMPKLELATRECSNPPLQDDVSDYFFMIFMIFMNMTMNIMAHPFGPNGLRKPLKQLGI